MGYPHITFKLLYEYDALSVYISWPLFFTPESKVSRMFGSAPAGIFKKKSKEGNGGKKKRTIKKLLNFECTLDILNIFSEQNCTMNWHHQGVAPSLYNSMIYFSISFSPHKTIANQKLASFYRILSTNVDREGKPFISSIEGS